ncbi:MAG: family 20 glycosylhydrolase, partial [Clostridiaceae bacterium]|nr:family 20 glycosylhydrolase [Clostridiaceae bacterium]
MKRVLVSLLISTLVLLGASALASNTGQPILNNPSFEMEILEEDIQMYKAERTDEKASDGNYSIKIGMAKPSDPQQIPMWLYNYGKGMIGTTIRNVKPNTTYQVQMDLWNETGVKMSTGVLDIQGQDTKSPWQLLSDIKGHHSISTEWTTRVHTITTGPRTSEIYAFAYTEWTGDKAGAGLFYIDNIRIEEVSTDNITASFVDYDPSTINDFPQTIPAIQKFERTNAGNFNLDRQKQVFSTDKFSYAKTKYLADAMVSKGIIADYTIMTINDINQGKGIVVFKKPINFKLPNKVAKMPCAVDAYQIDIYEDKVVIYANDIEGIQNGTMTILQAFSQRSALPAGSVHDYTDQIIRGLQVDSGRRYYSISWLKEQIEQMAYYKQNRLQLRLKDNEGIRFDSKIAPQMVDKKGGYWTEEEIKELVEFAREFNIEVVPEVDFPGHSEQEAIFFPVEWRLSESSRGLDFSREDVRQYMFAIYKEAIELFDAKTIHIGGDEYFQTRNLGSTDNLAAWAQTVTGDSSATAYDALILFFNEAASKIRETYPNIDILVWNDNIMALDGAAKLDPTIIIDFWAGGFYGSITPEDAVDAGYSIMSSSSGLYHDLWPQNNAGKLDRPLPKVLFEAWDRYSYSYGSYGPEDDRPLTTGAQKNKSLGQMFPIWDDAHGYVSEYILSRTLMPRYAVFAYKTWGADYALTASYSQFERLLFALGTPRSGMREHVTVNYTEADALKIMENIQKALVDLTDTTNAQRLYGKLDEIQKDISQYADENGFYTGITSEVINLYENLPYVSDA